MTTSLDPAPQPTGDTPASGGLLPPPVAPVAPEVLDPEPTRPQRKRSAVHVVAIVAGCLMLLPGFAMAFGGGALAVGQAVATDDDGYFRFTLDPLRSDGVAIASGDTWLDAEDEDLPWVLDWVDLDVRLRVDGIAATDDVFVGIARSADVDRYLAGSSYTSVIEIDDHAPVYEPSTGERRSVAPPAQQDFWAASAVGTGEQSLTWDARGGHWTIVVMNADGSSDVSADVEIGAKSDAVTTIAVVLTTVGGVVLLSAIALIVIGVRGRRDRAQPAANGLVIDDRPIV